MFISAFGLRKYLMRIAALASAVFLCSAFNASAENEDIPEFEIRVGVSGFPLLPSSENKFGGGSIFNKYVTYNDYSLDELYSNRSGARYTTGNIGAEFTYNIKKWLAICGGMYVSPFWMSTFDGYSHQRISTSASASLSGLVMVRFNYFNRPLVKLYSSVGIGVMADFSYYPVVAMHIQTVPFGISVGGRVFGFAELGLGSLYLGGNIGVGYKF